MMPAAQEYNSLAMCRSRFFVKVTQVKAGFVLLSIVNKQGQTMSRSPKRKTMISPVGRGVQVSNLTVGLRYRDSRSNPPKFPLHPLDPNTQIPADIQRPCQLHLGLRLRFIILEVETIVDLHRDIGIA